MTPKTSTADQAIQFEAAKPAAKPRTLTGAQIVMEALAEQGVDTIFGYPGGAVLPIYDAIYQQKKGSPRSGPP